MKIGKFNIGKGRCFIIAEIGNNHNGDIDRAMKMVDLAIKMGVDCVKFQMRHYLVETLDLDLDTEYLIQFHTWF